jgi:ABC-2 type transport system permease protein/lipopolysaccharide transport system permease protein
MDHDTTSHIVEPPPELRYRRTLSLPTAVRELWLARELVRTLAERDLRSRYKQASLGFAWAVILPLVFMVVFTVFFQKVANIDTGDVPYPLFAYLGLLPWTFFSNTVGNGASSLSSNLSIINKVYCPREVFPLAAAAVAAVDTAIATIALFVLFAITGYAPTATAIWVPVLLLVLLAFTLGIAFGLAAATVYIRDLKHALAIALQLGLFATPVAYSLSEIPSDLQPIYCFLNPLAPVIDGLRRTVLLDQQPDWSLLGLGALGATLALVGGYWLFKRLETGIADVA